MPYNTRSVTRKEEQQSKNMSPPKETNMSQPKMVRCYYTRSQAPKYIVDMSKKQQFYKNCGYIAVKQCNATGIRQQVTILNELVEYIRRNKDLFNEPSFEKPRETIRKKILLCHSKNEFCKSVANEWYFWIFDEFIE